MDNFDVFRDIATRTGGDIYIGVVGAARTGKSTFIKKFMDLLVVPNIEDENVKKRVIDELPQSGAGRTIMTTEPKFVPDEAVLVNIKEGIDVNVRLIDCVGFPIEGAVGYQDENGPRMVRTPWSEDEMAFEEAAEVGTRKVIEDHSTMGIVVITDGSVTDIPRENYLEAEEVAITKLKELGKPFVIVLNSRYPNEVETIELAQELEIQYEVPVIPVDCAQLSHGAIMQILEEALFEFPVIEVNVNLPKWIDELDEDHWLRKQFEDVVTEAIGQVKRLRDIDGAIETLSRADNVQDVMLEQMDMGTGVANVEMSIDDGLFFRVLNEVSGYAIEGEHDLLKIINQLSHAKREFDKVEIGLNEVREKGYGVVPPILSEMVLEEPELIKQGGRFGVKLKASAPALHIIKTDVTTEITPLMGTEKQCEDLVRYMLEKFEENPAQIWEYDIFGKSLHELVRENIQSKLQRMPDNAQDKLQETLKRIVNEGSGGLICIII